MPGDTLRLFTPEATFLISEILSDLQRPDFPSSWEFSPNITRVAWKTGTSYGRKDAWSIGYNPTYTIGVWVGNFSGESSPDIVGADAAAPLLFEVFKAIGPNKGSQWFSRPFNIESRIICSVSGMPPNPSCPSLIEEQYIYGVAPVATCNIHKEILIDSISGNRLCRYCEVGKKVVSKTIEDWPPKIATWLAKSGHSIAAVPEHNPFCTGTYLGDRPVIISPNEDAIYIIRQHIPLNQQCIPLEASVASGTNHIYWFVDGDLFGQSAVGGRVFYTPAAGTHKLVCADNEGRSSSVTFKIQ
jgi:penicillin-binding protein 1C